MTQTSPLASPARYPTGGRVVALFGTGRHGLGADVVVGAAVVVGAGLVVVGAWVVVVTWAESRPGTAKPVIARMP